MAAVPPPPPTALPPPPIPPPGASGGVPARAPLPTTVLLSNLPEFLTKTERTETIFQWVSNGLQLPARLIQRADPFCLVSLPNAEAAAQFAAALKLNDVPADLVPIDPSVPLPPAMVDPVVAKGVADRLSSIKDISDVSNNITPEPVSNDTLAVDETGAPVITPEDDPAVQRAVAAFRKSLEEQQGTKSIRRKQLVQEELNKAMERIKRGESLELPPPPLPPGGLPPPPVPGAPPPPPPPPAAVSAAAPRGVSNMPAWMTQQKQPEEPPASKKAKPANFSPVASLKPLQDLVTKLIGEALGEPDATLCQFCIDHVQGGKSTHALEQELADVLEGPTAQRVVEQLFEYAASQ